MTLLATACSSAAPQDARPAKDPRSMAMGAQVFAVGVLEYEDPAIPGWRTRGRQDVESGSLADIAARQEASSPIAWAVIGAAQLGEQSTGSWLFTEALVEGFAGSARADTDRDGIVTFGEVQGFVADEMAFGVGQSICAYAGQFGASTSVARTTAPREMVGERVEVLAGGAWWKAKVLHVGPGAERVKVRYYGWDASEDAWVDRERVRRANARTEDQDGRR